MPTVDGIPWISKHSVPLQSQPRKKGTPKESWADASEGNRSRAKRGRPREWYNLGLCHALDTTAFTKGCPYPAMTKGLCKGHYVRLMTQIDPGVVAEADKYRAHILFVIATHLRDPKKNAKPGLPCPGAPLVDGKPFECDRLTHTAGFCLRCYARTRNAAMRETKRWAKAYELGEVG